MLTFPKVQHDWLAHELDPHLYRKAGTIKSGAGTIACGAVLGRIVTDAATSAAKSGGNTGDGTLTPDATTPVLAGAKAGIYTVRIVAAAANGGTFRVEDPDGYPIGDVAVGATFAEQIKFATADGGTDFVVGDGFDITVAAGSEKYVPVDFDANDGSSVAVAIALDACDATSADKEIGLLIGQAKIVPGQLTWPDGATTQQKAAALKQLATLHIIDHQRY